MPVALDQPVDDDHRVARASRRDPGVLALEVGVGQLADLDRADDPAPVDEVGLRSGGDAVRGLDRLVGIDRPSASAPRTRATKSRAGSSGSSVRTPTTVSPSAACSASFASRSGNSSRHGTQLGPPEVDDDGPARAGSRGRTPPRRASCRRWPAPATRPRPAARPILPGARSRPIARAARPPRWSGPRRAGRAGSAGAAVVIGRLLERRRPRHVRVDGAHERVGAGRQGGDVVDPRLDAVEDVASPDRRRPTNP